MTYALDFAPGIKEMLSNSKRESRRGAGPEISRLLIDPRRKNTFKVRGDPSARRFRVLTFNILYRIDEADHAVIIDGVRDGLPNRPRRLSTHEREDACAERERRDILRARERRERCMKKIRLQMSREGGRRNPGRYCD